MERSFYNACKKGWMDDVKELASPTTIGWLNPNDRHMAGIHAACDRHQTRVVSFLLGHGAMDVNLEDGAQRTPLYIACSRGYLDLVELLAFDDRVDPNLADHDNASPLWISCWSNNLETAKALMRIRQDLDMTLETVVGGGVWHSKTIEEAAKMSQNRELVRLVQEYTANPQSTSERLQRERDVELAQNLDAQAPDGDSDKEEQSS